MCQQLGPRFVRIKHIGYRVQYVVELETCSDGSHFIVAGQRRSSQYCSTFPKETFGKNKTHVYFGLWQKRPAKISSDQN